MVSNNIQKGKPKDRHYVTNGYPKPLADGSKARRREILQARLKRGESVPAKLLIEFSGENW